jgi:hypothetical protein
VNNFLPSSFIIFAILVSGLVYLATVIASKLLVTAAAIEPATNPAIQLILSSFSLNFSYESRFFSLAISFSYILNWIATKVQ